MTLITTTHATSCTGLAALIAAATSHREPATIAARLLACRPRPEVLERMAHRLAGRSGRYIIYATSAGQPAGLC